MSHKHTLTTPSDREIRVERVFEASRERVWKAMTQPELLAQWWGRGNKLDVITYEPVKGGHWRFVEHSEGQQHGFEGRFGEIVPMESVRQTFEWDGMPTHVILEQMKLEDAGPGRTKIVTTSLFMTKEDRDGMMMSGMEDGMAQGYAALDALLARMAA
jgi:uncharacterized protein YndB with AHSA1/START domain